MQATTIALIVFGCMLAGVALGRSLQSALPDHHLSKDSKDAVTLAAGLVATLAALVLGLLVSTAAGSFNSENDELNQIAAQTILLDRMMAEYGPETREAREQLRRSVLARLALLWPKDGSRPPKASIAADADFEGMQANLRALSPRSEAQKGLQADAVKAALILAQTRWLLIVQEEEGSIPLLFIVVLTIWLAAIFASFSLFAPRNLTIAIALMIGALSVSGAVFLILELGSPYGGMIKLSSMPLRLVLEHLGK